MQVTHLSGLLVNMYKMFTVSIGGWSPTGLAAIITVRLVVAFQIKM